MRDLHPALLRLATLVPLLLSTLGPASAVAQGRDQAAEVQITRRLAAKSPQAVAVWERATAALDGKRTREAEAGYRKVLELAPDFPDALRRLSYVTADSDQRVRLARRAYKLDDRPANLMGLTEALARRIPPEGNPMGSTDGDESRELAKLLIKKTPEDPGAHALAAHVALVMNDRELLGRTLGPLKRLAPKAPQTHYFAAIAAAMDEEWEAAEAAIKRAREFGLPADVADGFLAKIDEQTREWRYLKYTGYAAAIWAAGLAFLLLLGLILSRLTLSTVESASPEATSEPTGGMRTLRRIYAVVLTFTSIYFYISIPMVLLLVLAAGGGVFYAFMAIGRIPIKLVLIIGIGVLITIWAMLKSLFIRRRDEDPGKLLKQADAPRLFELLRDVAGRVGTRPVDAVYLVADATIAVMERGSLLKRMSGRSQRCLILGLGVPGGMSENQLKAILAHEYGHFSNKDTAGGDLALHVRTSIYGSAQAMAEGGAAAWYNPAWLFLNGYHRIYLRVSQGASRLQEVLADRWAAVTYGATAFADGLRHVIRRAVVFDLQSNQEVSLALSEDRPVRNLYQLRPEDLGGVESSAGVSDDERDAATAREAEEAEEAGAAEAGAAEEPGKAAGELEAAIEAAFSEAMNDPGSVYDSHPAPGQRIAWVERLEGAPDLPSEGAPAWALMANRARLEEAMTAMINDHLALARQYEAAGAEQGQYEED